MSPRSYLDALQHLTTVQSIEDAKNVWLAAGKPSKAYIIDETVGYLERLGYVVRFKLQLLTAVATTFLRF